MNIIIALGHSGYEIDMELAENIAELDLVVGGIDDYIYIYIYIYYYTYKSEYI